MLWLIHYVQCTCNLIENKAYVHIRVHDVWVLPPLQYNSVDLYMQQNDWMVVCLIIRSKYVHVHYTMHLL